jgi:hypothetical protein
MKKLLKLLLRRSHGQPGSRLITAIALVAMMVSAGWTGKSIQRAANGTNPNIPYRLRQEIYHGEISNQKLVNLLNSQSLNGMGRQNNFSKFEKSTMTISGQKKGLSSFSRRYTPNQSLNTNFWIPNNTVNSVVVDDAHDRVYIGGNFSYIGPYTGPFVKLDSSAGVRDAVFPEVSGYVDVILPDGSGGFYIGGGFTQIGATFVNNLAHIRSDGSVVESFNPNPDGDVSALAFKGSDIVVGGFFSNIGGQSRADLAEVDTSTGNIVASWTPPSFDSGVSTVVVYGGSIYLAGDFSTIGDSARNHIGAIDTGGVSATAWNPNPDNSYHFPFVSTLVAANGFVYAGGNFTSIGSSSLIALAELDTTDGNATAWDPQIITDGSGGANVNQLQIVGDKLCVGGNFYGFGATRQGGFAALDTSNGTISGWKTGVDTTDYVTCFDITDGKIFFGGGFSWINGEPRASLAASDTSGNLLSWAPNADGSPNAIVDGGGAVYVGGGGSSFGGAARGGVAAYTESTGQLTGLSVDLHDINNQVIALALHDTTLYVGGVFSSAGGLPRNGLAAFSTNTGNVLPFNANLVAAPWSFYSGSPDIFALKVYGNNLYAGGQFQASGDSTRNNLASFDLSTGDITSWNPDANGSSQPWIAAMDAAGGKIYFGGKFVNAGDSVRTHLAAVDTITGTATSWNPILTNPPYNNDNFNVSAITLDGSTVYVGGDFYNVNGQQDSSIAAIDTSSTGTLLSWNPHIDAYPQSIALSGSLVYMGGWFSEINGQTLNYVGAVDKVNGTPVTGWNLNINSVVDAIGISQQYKLVYIGGEFDPDVLGSFSPYFAAVTNPEDASLPVQATDFIATSDINSVTLSWKTQSEVNNAGFNVLRQQPDVTGWQLVGSYTTDKSLRGLGTSSFGNIYSFTDAKVVSGKSYNYRIQSVSTNGTTKDLSTLSVTVDVPKTYALYQNYPNPFNPSTTIRFDLKEQSNVTLDIYNVLGQRVFEDNYGAMNAGRFNKVVNMDRFASGVYFYRIAAVGNDGQKYVSIKKLVLMK